jgi:tetratricopeptide (TPR) repeat protein
VEPALPEDITGKELDRSVWRELRTLTKENAEGVAKHLVAAATLLEDDPDLALAHAEHAARRAGRVAAVREALGLVHYRRSEFTDAIREFRTAKRLSGSNHLLPYLVDCERGLGRYERALDLAVSPEARSLGEADNIELAIVVSGVRRDLGQPDAAQMVLRIPALEHASSQPWAARLFYAYAEALLASGAEDEARDWFVKAATADADGQTDATDRIDELDGIVLTDVLDGAQPDESVGDAGSDDGAPAEDDGHA